MTHPARTTQQKGVQKSSPLAPHVDPTLTEAVPLLELEMEPSTACSTTMNDVLGQLFRLTANSSEIWRRPYVNRSMMTSLTHYLIKLGTNMSRSKRMH